METSIQNTLKKITRRDRRFNEEAYLFVLSALDLAVSQLSEPRHVTGPELLDAIREYGIKQYGPMAFTVLDYWGIGKTEDFGDIVFNMIEEEILRKTDSDKREDFKNVYNLKEAFNSNFN